MVRPTTPGAGTTPAPGAGHGARTTYAADACLPPERSPAAGSRPAGSVAGLTGRGAWGSPAFAPRRAFAALDALAPWLLLQDFRSIPGGLRLLGTRLDLLVDSKAAGLSAPPDPLVAYARAQGQAALFLGWDPDKRIVIDAALPGDGPWGMTRLAGWRPWCLGGLDGLWLEPPVGRDAGRLLQITTDGLSWERELPVTNGLDLLMARDHMRDATRAARRAMGINL
jgi:hypothetical protein